MDKLTFKLRLPKEIGHLDALHRTSKRVGKAIKWEQQPTPKDK